MKRRVKDSLNSSKKKKKKKGKKPLHNVSRDTGVTMGTKRSDATSDTGVVSAKNAMHIEHMTL